MRAAVWSVASNTVDLGSEPKGSQEGCSRVWGKNNMVAKHFLFRKITLLAQCPHLFSNIVWCGCTQALAPRM